MTQTLPGAETLPSALALRGADIVVRTLERAGHTTIFTLSGNHIMSLFDAAIGTRLDLIHTRHEAAAVHAADAFGRLTGRPGLAMVTGGPGHANATAALMTALGQESPLVLLSGHTETTQLGRGGFQELRQAEMAAPVAKASWMATDTARPRHGGCARRSASPPPAGPGRCISACRPTCSTREVPADGDRLAGEPPTSLPHAGGAARLRRRTPCWR